MRSISCLLFALATCQAIAAPYPLGTMTCDDIGAFSSEAMTWRKSQVSYEEAKMRVENREYGDPVEKKNLATILGFVYGNYGNNWSIEAAGNVMRSDCRKGRDDRASVDRAITRDATVSCVGACPEHLTRAR